MAQNVFSGHARQGNFCPKNHFEFCQKTALKIFLNFCMELDINKDYKLAQIPFSGRSRLGGYGAQKGPEKAENMTHLTLTRI